MIPDEVLRNRLFHVSPERIQMIKPSYPSVKAGFWNAGSMPWNSMRTRQAFNILPLALPG